jgi:hypothetical protein
MKMSLIIYVLFIINLVGNVSSNLILSEYGKSLIDFQMSIFFIRLILRAM